MANVGSVDKRTVSYMIRRTSAGSRNSGLFGFSEGFISGYDPICLPLDWTFGFEQIEGAAIFDGEVHIILVALLWRSVTSPRGAMDNWSFRSSPAQRCRR
jgi:hypothetical protein